VGDLLHHPDSVIVHVTLYWQQHSPGPGQQRINIQLPSSHPPILPPSFFFFPTETLQAFLAPICIFPKAAIFWIRFPFFYSLFNIASLL
jgi:hypothetical protein